MTSKEEGGKKAFELHTRSVVMTTADSTSAYGVGEEKKKLFSGSKKRPGALMRYAAS